MIEKIGERVLVPIKGVFLNADGSRQSGFRNAMVSGILLKIDESGAVHLGNEEGSLLTIVPKDSVGAILTDGSTFYQGADDDIISEFEDLIGDPDDSLN